MVTQTSKLEKLVEFAKKGGIGTCVASQDISARSEADLMFYTGEVITVLKHVKDDTYLGYCEGVIGTFKGKTVKFNGSLKSPKSMKTTPSSQSSSIDNSDQSSPKQRSFLHPSDSIKRLSPNSTNSESSDKENSSQSSSSSSIDDSDQSSPKQKSFLHPSDTENSSQSSLNSSIDNFDQDSPKQKNFPRSSDSAKGLSSNDANSEPLDTENNSQSNPPSPMINIIPDISDNVYNAPLFNQHNARVVPSQRKSSLLYEHSVPISPIRQNTMPQLSSSEPEPQRRNNTVPIIATNQERSINSNFKPNHFNSSSPSSPSHVIVPNDKINSRRVYQPPQINSQNQVNQMITRERQNSSPAIPNNNIFQNVPAGRPRGSSFNNPQIPRMQNAPPYVNTSTFPRNGHHHSKSSPNINRFYDSPLNSSVSPNYNKNSQAFDPRPFQNKSYDQTFNNTMRAGNFMINGRASPSSPIPPHSPPPGHYSPSTTPLPSPKMPQMKFYQEPNIVIDDHDSPSTSPLPSPHFDPRNISNNLRSYEGRVTPANTPTSAPILTTPANTPALTPTLVTPKITIEDSDLDDSDDDDQEESLISYRSSSVSLISSQSKPAEDSTLKVENNPYSRSDTSSEQLSANESEDVSSEDGDENKAGVKNETGETVSSKSSKKKKDQILAIDEYGFVYDVAEEDIPPGADRIQRIIQAPGTEEKTTRTIRLYREREAKWVALLGSMDPNVARDSRKIKKLVRSGIPESVRGKAWQFMACADKYRKIRYYDELRNKPRIPIYDVIEKDIHRCYPDHIQFREESGFGQDDLHDILKAYAHYNPGVGYCQGMGRLVGMMLMQMPAEDTFWLLVATIEEYMAGYFTPTLSQVRIDSIVFDQLLAEHDPKLHQHLANNGVVPLMYMTQWFMTIFTMALPWASVLRVWDIFYFEGVKLFFRIGLAIMDCTKEYILKNCPTNSELLGFLLHIPHELLTPDLLLEAAFKIRLKRSAIKRMTKKATEIEKNKKNDGSDAVPVITPSGSKETRKELIKKSKSTDKLKVVNGIEFKLES